LEAGGWSLGGLEVGGWRGEAGGRRVEVGGWKFWRLEVGGGLGFQPVVGLRVRWLMPQMFERPAPSVESVGGWRLNAGGGSWRLEV
jgi:hypothetical protein